MKITFLGNFAVSYSSENHHKKSLEALGHEVIALQEAHVRSEVILRQALESDVFVWVHTHGWPTEGIAMREVLKQLKEKGIPTLTYHLDLWLGLERQKDMQKDDYWFIEHFFTADANMAEWLNKNTNIKGHYLPAGVFHEETYMAEPNNDKKWDVIFVGSKGYHPEWPYRPRLINWLAETYGDRFAHFGGDGRGVVRGAELNQLYANTKVVVGDTLCLNFNYPNYFSDRLFETTGRGGMLIFPEIEGLATLFGESEVVKYKFNDFDYLKSAIDVYVANDELREIIRRRGFERTKNNHTYKHRWQSILQTIGKA